MFTFIGLLLFKLLQIHLYVSILNIIFYEGIKQVFGHRIIANGWREHYKREDAEFYEEVSTKPKYDIVSFLIMFIPIWNISFTLDLIDMIIFTPEQIEAMDEEDKR